MRELAMGWDIHRKFSKVSVQQMTDDGQISVVERARLEHCDREGMRRWLGRMPAGTPVALEAAFGWPWIADLLEEAGLEPRLGHPPAVKVLAQHEAKGDRCDSDRLGKFQLRGILPESYLAPPEVRQRRERVRYRMALVRLQTGVKNRIQAILHRLGILHSFSDLFGKMGRAFLAKLDLPQASRMVLEGYLRLLDQLHEEIQQVEQWMRRNMPCDEVVQWLMTLPGVGLILAHVIRAEIGQIDRFPSYRHLASYDGLAPLSDDSADHHGRRHCSPACNHTLRWALIEAVTGALATRDLKAWRLKKLYGRLTGGGRYNKNQAKVAVAREMSKLVYVVWTKGQPYTDTPPARPGIKNPCADTSPPRPATPTENPAAGPTPDRDKTAETPLTPEPRNHGKTTPPSPQPKSRKQGKTAQTTSQPKSRKHDKTTNATSPAEPGNHGETTETTLRPDQSRHPMVRQRPQAVGQTLS
jgi:transposase